MEAIMQTTFWYIFSIAICCILKEISLKCDPMDLIDNVGDGIQCKIVIEITSQER